MSRTEEREDIYEALDQERDYQDKKWGTYKRHSNVEYLVYMRSYINEALELASRNDDQEVAHKVRANIRKITALGVVAMEQNGVEYRR